MRNSDSSCNRDKHLQHCLDRYKKVKEGAGSAYFDEDEMEDIIDYYLDNNKLKDATEAINYGLQLHPDSVSIQARQANVFLCKGDVVKAKQLIDKLISLEPDNEDILLCKGELLLMTNKKDEARRVFKGLMSKPDVVIEDMSQDIAYIYLNHQMFKEARSFLSAGFSNGGRENIDLCCQLAYCDEQLGFTDDAIRLYNMVLDKNPYWGDVWFSLGQIYFSRTDYENAIVAFDYAYLTDKSDFEALLSLANSYFQNGNYMKAVKTYQSYAEKTGKSAKVEVYIGECYDQMGEKEKAEDYYVNALEMDPNNDEGLANLAFCRMEQNRYAEALPLLLRSIQKNPEAGSSWIYLGETYENLDRLDEAIGAYMHAQQFFPESADIYASIGEVYVYKGEFEKALTCLTKAQSSDPDIDELPLLLAITYYKLGQRHAAIENLTLAIAKNGEDRKGFFDLCPEALNDADFVNFNKQ